MDLTGAKGLMRRPGLAIQLQQKLDLPLEHTLKD